jgi:Phage tail lysozyme
MTQRFSKVFPKGEELKRQLEDIEEDPALTLISRRDLGDSEEVVWEDTAAPDLPGESGGGGGPAAGGGDFGSGPFKVKAPLVMKQLLKDFPEFNKVHVAAILGNIGVESAGFTAFHEFGQPEDKGGIGWCQWTGRPGRRQDFEKFCSDQNLNIRSDEASYKFLAHEMRGTEKGVVKPLSQMTDLAEATKFFMTKFERPGKKAEDERVKFAKTALDAFDAGS